MPTEIYVHYRLDIKEIRNLPPSIVIPQQDTVKVLFNISNSQQRTNATTVENSGCAIFPSDSKGAQLNFQKNFLYEEATKKFVPYKCTIQVAKGDDIVIAQTQLNVALYVNVREPNFELALDLESGFEADSYQ